MTGSYDRLYVIFIYYFNDARDYFECHEVMEELWLEEGRYPLYQGLLQVAVGLYHYRNGNLGGAVKLMTAALDKLDRYPGAILGIDLEQLRRDSRIYLNKLLDAERQPFVFYDLTIRITDPALSSLVGAIRLAPPEPHEED